jgi:hypothetical protein
MKNKGLSLCAALVALVAAGCAAPLSRPVSSIEIQGAAYSIVVPSTGLVLEFPGNGFKVQQADDHRPYYFLSNEKTKLNVSFNFEPATKCKTSEACRDYFAEKLKSAFPNKKNWRSFKVGEVYASENLDGPVSGYDLRQQHVNAHIVREGVWIDVHLSKVRYQEADRELFLSFIRSIRVRQKTARA